MLCCSGDPTYGNSTYWAKNKLEMFPESEKDDLRVHLHKYQPEYAAYAKKAGHYLIQIRRVPEHFDNVRLEAGDSAAAGKVCGLNEFFCLRMLCLVFTFCSPCS